VFTDRVDELSYLEGMGVVRRDATVLGKERPLYVIAD